MASSKGAVEVDSMCRSFRALFMMHYCQALPGLAKDGGSFEAYSFTYSNE
jgi:hypothetical protein